MQKFIDILNNLKKLKIAVVGDGMIDEYYYVSANRISPEFPIITLSSYNQTPDYALPGGAANVCNQFMHFDIDVHYFGFVDANLYNVLSNYKINIKNAQWLGGKAHIPIKRRLYNGQFPFCRWDIELPNYGIDTDVQYSEFDKLKNNYDLVIFSDYNKGLFNNVSSVAEFLGDTPFLVDPKKGPIEKWYGCNIFKPNYNEAKELSGLTDWKEQCSYFKEKLNCEAVVITNSGNGVFGLDKNGYFKHSPNKCLPFESVIGAGDCFMAFLAMAYASNTDVNDAAAFAYEAGTVYVQNKHNKPVSKYDLIKYVDPIAAKFVEPDFLKNRDYKLVFTNGCFDLGLHKGHLECLSKAKQFGDKLVVAINSDASVQALKGKKRPIVELAERMSYIAALEFVDFVISFDEETPYELIKTIQPDIIVKGGDYKPEDVSGHDLVEKVVIIPLVENKSTTDRINKIKKLEKSAFNWGQTTYRCSINGETT